MYGLLLALTAALATIAVPISPDSGVGAELAAANPFVPATDSSTLINKRLLLRRRRTFAKRNRDPQTRRLLAEDGSVVAVVRERSPEDVSGTDDQGGAMWKKREETAEDDTSKSAAEQRPPWIKATGRDNARRDAAAGSEDPKTQRKSKSGDWVKASSRDGVRPTDGSKHQASTKTSSKKREESVESEELEDTRTSSPPPWIKASSRDDGLGKRDDASDGAALGTDEQGGAMWKGKERRSAKGPQRLVRKEAGDVEEQPIESTIDPAVDPLQESSWGAFWRRDAANGQKD